MPADHVDDGTHDEVPGQARGEMDVIHERGEPLGRGLRHVPQKGLPEGYRLRGATTGSDS